MLSLVSGEGIAMCSTGALDILNVLVVADLGSDVSIRDRFRSVFRRWVLHTGGHRTRRDDRGYIRSCRGMASIGLPGPSCRRSAALLRLFAQEATAIAGP
jgi:hypothetical protein